MTDYQQQTIEILKELENLASERINKYYLSQGAKEPFFGVPTGAMKPLVKRIGKNQPLAEALFNSGNYDGMYLAGMIADPKVMTAEDFKRWIGKASFYMVGDHIVSVTLAETAIAESVADDFIESGHDFTMSAGWSCYEWLLGSRKDSEFQQSKLAEMLKRVEQTIQEQPPSTKDSMNRFVMAIGVSYSPLHEEALEVAKNIGQLTIEKDGKLKPLRNAFEAISKEAEKGRIGFKRKHVRC